VNRRLTQRGKDRRRQLMDFAAHRFADNGYHPTSVAEIVQGMGVGKGVFYWYFSSKEELFLEILKEAQTDLRRRQQQAIADTEDPVERIEAGIRATMGWLAENRHLSGLFQFAASEERFAPALRRGQEVAVGDVVRHVKEGIVAGRIRDTDPLVLSHAILGVTNHLARVFIFERDEPADAVADAAIGFCLDGLLGPAPVGARAARLSRASSGRGAGS
jgi:AcrR family transcriptional regulator